MKKIKKCSDISKSNLHTSNFIFENLAEKGRLQYFFHSPSSKFPIRDVLDEQKKGPKTEPHIEIGAENYLSRCYQSNNILPFLNSNEKFLFLFTTCKDTNHKYYGKKCIVGYILKKKSLEIKRGRDNKSHYAVIGDIFLFSFDDCLPIESLKYNEGIRVRKVNEKDTKIILNHFKNKENILYECIKEIRRLDKNNKTCERDSKYFDCQFQNQCLRWKKSHV